MQRRTYLSAVAGASVVLAGCGGSEEYGDWFANVDNYDGERELTGESQVTVAVGADDGFAFDPAAIKIDTGTTVLWEWTGEGGRHNVVERDGAFASEYYRETGETFEYDFESTGLYPYVCEPHEGMGMKGGVRVE